MNFSTKFIVIVTFSMLSKVNDVYGGWEWTQSNVECLKGKFTGYVKGMEDIFSPNGQLGRYSYYEKIANMDVSEVLEMGNFITEIGELVGKCKIHLNHENYTASKKLSANARSVILTLCSQVKRNCKQVSNPMPLSDKLYATFDQMHGSEDEYKRNCGEIIVNTAISNEDSYSKKKKKKGNNSAWGGLWSRG